MPESLIQIYRRRIDAGDLTADPAQEAVLAELQRIRDALESEAPRASGLKGFFRRAPEGTRGLYLWGGVGRGKSMLMDLFHGAVDIRQKRRVHFHAFMQEVQAGLHAARQEGVSDPVKPVAEGIVRDVRLLSFDEMQIGDIADAMIVGRLFQQLFDAGVTVVTTSNRVPDDLYKDGLNRKLFLPFIDLIKARMEVMHLDAPKDYRQDRLAGTETYFTPADAEARQAIDALWQGMTGGHEEPLELQLKGRSVEIPRFHAGCARAGFYDLCGRPLGPGDYLALADRVRVLVIENIPRLGSENYNEARRFVTLVDALYEAKVRVIASAADKPENLYIEGAGSFEFERTASRLREMQSDGWGADRAP